MSTPNGKVAVVTGASSGIGYAVAIEMMRKGFKVIACARRLERLETLKKELGGTELLVPFRLDITNIGDIVRLRDFISTLPEAKLHVLFNNAGQVILKPALDSTQKDMEGLFQVNFFGHVNMCKELIPFLINAKGTVLFTGSVAGSMTFPFGSLYGATKAAIHSYARSLHLEIKPFGVRVINIVTGGVASDISDNTEMPETSLYNFKEGKDVLKKVKNSQDTFHPQKADDYAKSVVSILLSKKDSVDIFKGQGGLMGWIAPVLLPYWLQEWILTKLFGLEKCFRVIREKIKKQ